MLLLYIAPSDGDDDDHDVVHNERWNRDDDHADADNSIKVKNKEEKTPVQICHNLYIHQKCFFFQHILHYNPEEVLKALLATNKNSLKNR